MKQRQTQRQRLRELFELREGQWIPLPEILSMSIAQFGARLKELRDIEGMEIKNRMDYQNGVVRSWYRYTKPKGQGQLFEQVQSERRPKHVLEIQRTTF